MCMDFMEKRYHYLVFLLGINIVFKLFVLLRINIIFVLVVEQKLFVDEFPNGGVGSEGIGDSVLKGVGGVVVLIRGVALCQNTEAGGDVVAEFPDTE